MSIDEVLAAGAVRSVFQPIVDLDTGQVVAYEALARGPEGPLARPDALFAAARLDGRLAELDAACRTAAFRGAVEQGLLGTADAVRQRRAGGARHGPAGRPAGDRRGCARAAARRPGDHRAGARRAPGGPAPHGRAGPRARLGGGAGRRRRGRAVAGVHAAAAAGRRQARPAPGAGATRSAGRRDHERGERLRRAQRRADPGRGHRDRAAPADRPGAGRPARAGVAARPAGAGGCAPGYEPGELVLPGTAADGRRRRPRSRACRRGRRCAARRRTCSSS